MGSSLTVNVCKHIVFLPLSVRALFNSRVMLIPSFQVFLSDDKVISKVIDKLPEKMKNVSQLVCNFLHFLNFSAKIHPYCRLHRGPFGSDTDASQS